MYCKPLHVVFGIYLPMQQYTMSTVNNFKSNFGRIHNCICTDSERILMPFIPCIKGMSEHLSHFVWSHHQVSLWPQCFALDTAHFENPIRFKKYFSMIKAFSLEPLNDSNMLLLLFLLLFNS